MYTISPRVRSTDSPKMHIAASESGCGVPKRVIEGVCQKLLTLKKRGTSSLERGRSPSRLIYACKTNPQYHRTRSHAATGTIIVSRQIQGNCVAFVTLRAKVG